jgi:hypothetical protein
VALYNGPGNALDEALSLAIDAEGNVYVTGRSVGSGTNSDYATIKYNSAGAQQWVSRYDGPASDWDGPSAVALDSAGNVYVTGGSIGSGTLDDCATIKYNSAGVQQWVARYNGSANGNDGGNAIAIDGAYNVYVAGQTGSDYLTLKYNSAGVQQWVATYNGPGNSTDVGRSVAVNSIGNVYVTGVSAGSGTEDDYATIKYNSAGAQQWAARYDGPASDDDGANALVLDAMGYIYVTGRSIAYFGSWASNYATIKYDMAGTELWVMRYPATGAGLMDNPTSLAVDGLGNVYVTGTAEPFPDNPDFATLKYSQLGPPTPVVLSSFNATLTDDGVKLRWQTASEIECYGWMVQRRVSGQNYQDISPLIAGHGTSVEPHEYDFLDQSVAAGQACTYRLKQIDMDGSVTFSDPLTISILPSSKFYACSPNPFNASAILRYELRDACHVQLCIFNVSGQPVAKIMDRRHDAGIYEVRFDGSGLASGIYIASLKAGDSAAMQKVVLLK